MATDRRCRRSANKTRWGHMHLDVEIAGGGGEDDEGEEERLFSNGGGREGGVFCCASRCQMPDPTALRQGLQLFFFLLSTALAMHVRLMMQPPDVRRPQRERSSLHHGGLTRLEASRKLQ